MERRSKWREGSSFDVAFAFFASYSQTLNLSNIHSIFFEKLRLLEGREKSEERLRNEALYPFGFSTKKKQKSEAQIVSHDLLHKGAVRCEGGGEMDERSSETDLKCYDQFA
jgi:hypothetical protein